MNIAGTMERLCTCSLRRRLRRGMALALTLAMILPMTPAFASRDQLYPTQQADADERPKIELEGNFVRDDFGLLTGYFELGLRVQTPTDKTFEYLGVTLEYDPELLTPVDWSDTSAPITVSGTYSVPIPTQKLDELSTAAAWAGEPVDSNDRKLLYFVARAPKIEYKEMTTIATIRFKVNEDMMEKLRISMVGEDEYNVYYKDTEISTLKDLTDVSGYTAFKFAPDEDITGSAVDMALLYKAGGYNVVGTQPYGIEFYHVPGYVSADADTHGEVTVTIDDYTYSLDKPNTAHDTVLAVDPAAESGLPGKYSYLSNLLVNQDPDYEPDPEGTDSTQNYIAMTIVSKRSFTAQDNMIDNLTTIVYVDWDDTILGAQVVPKNMDIRSLVSNYVAENFIYHDEDDKEYNPAYDINDPAQIAAEAGVQTEDIVSSLERKYNYRGKYPATEPMTLNSDGSVINDALGTALPNDADGVNLGAQKPLSNKLDYVFFKRPMEHTVSYETLSDADPDKYPAKPDPADDKYVAENDGDPSGEENPDYIVALAAYEKAYNDWYYDQTEWSQKRTVDPDTGLATPYWDTENPYAYGWAKCTVDNYKDVWTTLGMGELGSTTAATEDGSYAKATGTAMGYSGAFYGGYQDLSTAANTVASVTYDGDAAFAFADLEKGFSEDTVFLKAVYEPGTELMQDDYTYRMITTPYYNKHNPSTAVDGGAYTAEFTLERSFVMETDGCVRGVARIRDAVVRQETTADLRWEESDAPKVDHDLPNANLTEAKNTTKTTYTRVPVDNEEQIEVMLTFSARQNKTSYYLQDQYGGNFVASSFRSLSNFNRMEAMDSQNQKTYSEYWVADNYNYYVEGQSYEGDQWYDAPYEKREGSYGFVLSGTLNAIMEKCTDYVRDNSDTTMLQYGSVNAMNDCNLYDENGAPVTTTSQAIAVLLALVNAAKEAKTAAEDDDFQWWHGDLETGYAELTYHQAQNYILNSTLLPDATEANLITGLTWCHLHKDCAAASSDAPDTWAELIDAARNHSEYIDLMTQNEAEKLARLRKDIKGTVNAGGEAFTDLTDFKITIVAAVQALDAAAGGGTQTTIYNWNQVQAQIIRDQGDYTAYSPNDDFWWYDGATTSVIDDYPTDFLGALKAATDSTTPKAPDGDTSARMSKLNQLEDAYNANRAAADANYGDTTTDWVKATHNLAVTDGMPFSSFDDFTSQVTTAYATLSADGCTDPDWYQLQYMILNPGAAVPAAKDQPDAPAVYADYWWYDGDKQITDIRSMLDAANKNGAVWKNFNQAKWDELKTNDPGNFYFVKEFDGTPFSSVAEFRSAIETIAGNNARDTDLNWAEVQYLIIHANDDPSPVTPPIGGVAGTESDKYYWWAGGNTVPPTMTHTNTRSKVQSSTLVLIDISELLEAVFRIEKNGIPDDNSGLTSDVLEEYRFQTQHLTDSETVTSHLASADDLIKTVTTLLQTLRENGVGSDYAPPSYSSLTWFQVQYGLLNGGVLADSATPIPTDDDYWWRLKDANKTALDEILELMTQVTDGTITALTGFVTTNVNTSKLQLATVKAAGLKRKNGTTAFTVQSIVNNECKILFYLAQEVNNLSDADKAQLLTGGTLNFTLAELQYAISNGTVDGTTSNAATVLSDILAARAAAGSLSLSAYSLGSPVSQLEDLLTQLKEDPEYAASSSAAIREKLAELEAALEQAEAETNAQAANAQTTNDQTTVVDNNTVYQVDKDTAVLDVDDASTGGANADAADGDSPDSSSDAADGDSPDSSSDASGASSAEDASDAGGSGEPASAAETGGEVSSGGADTAVIGLNISAGSVWTRERLTVDQELYGDAWTGLTTLVSAASPPLWRTGPPYPAGMGAEDLNNYLTGRTTA